VVFYTDGRKNRRPASAVEAGDSFHALPHEPVQLRSAQEHSLRYDGFDAARVGDVRQRVAGEKVCASRTPFTASITVTF